MFPYGREHLFYYLSGEKGRLWQAGFQSPENDFFNLLQTIFRSAVNDFFILLRMIFHLEPCEESGVVGVCRFALLTI